MIPSFVSTSFIYTKNTYILEVYFTLLGRTNFNGYYGYV